MMENCFDRHGNFRPLTYSVPQRITDRNRIPIDLRKLGHTVNPLNWSSCPTENWIRPTDGWYYNDSLRRARCAQDLADSRRRLESIFVKEKSNCVLHQGPTRRTNTIPFFRLYHPINRDHFYTTDLVEAEIAVEKYAFKNEWIECFILKEQVPGAIPLFRLYKHQTKDHFYTPDRKERLRAEKSGYRYEGRAGYIFPNQQPNTVPLFRLYRHNIRDHFYTTDITERDRAVNKLAFKFEWIQAFAFASSDRKNHR